MGPCPWTYLEIAQQLSKLLFVSILLTLNNMTQSTAQQILKDVSFADIAKVVGPSNPGNPWAVIKSILKQRQIDIPNR
jgi:hypothetical protein